MGRPIKWIEDRRENFFATTQERGQVLRIAQPSQHFRRVFTDIIGLDEYVEIFPSEAAALAS